MNEQSFNEALKNWKEKGYHVLNPLQMKRFYWEGICRENRVVGIHRMQGYIQQYGFIHDFKLFSDIAISLIIEVELQKVDELYHDLARVLEITGYESMPSHSKAPCLIFCNVTFTQGTGNMLIEVPAVPG